MSGLPPPLAAGRLCPRCGGTGADAVKTAKARGDRAIDQHAWIRCWNCHGNGLDPAAYFRFVPSATRNHQEPSA